MIHEYIVLFFLTFGNYLNYIDRSLTFTYLPQFGEEFNMTKTDQGILASSFLGGYVIFSIVFCIMAQQMKTTKVVLIGCVIWSLSCLLMFFGKKELLYPARILSGVGEAAYQSLIPAFIEKNFNQEKVPIYLGIFFSGIYVGTSIGIAIGGITYNVWRYAYFVELISMLFNIVFLAIYIKYEQFQKISITCHQFKKILYNIFTNKFWWACTTGYSFYNFTSGAVNTWLPSFIKDKFPTYKFDELQITLGIVIMVSSLISACLSGIPVKYLSKKFPDYYLSINGFFIVASFLLSLAPIYISLNVNLNWAGFVTCVGFFILFLTATTLPINLILLDLVDDSSKNYSMALSICFIHLIGDIPSPIIVGKIWDATQNATLAIQYSTIGLLISILIYSFVAIFLYKKNKNDNIGENLLDNDSLSEEYKMIDDL